MSCGNVSILICSYLGSRYLEETIDSIGRTTGDIQHELFVDIEPERTGIRNTPNRYQKLFEESSGDYIVKSDDDVLYFSGWIEACIDVLDQYPNIGYVSPLNHLFLNRMGIRDLYVSEPMDSGMLAPEPSKFLSGACWVFRRWLWEEVPYGHLNGIKSLDSNFGASVRKAGYQPAYLPKVLCSHLGVDRHGGVDVVEANS